MTYKLIIRKASLIAGTRYLENKGAFSAQLQKEGAHYLSKLALMKFNQSISSIEQNMRDQDTYIQITNGLALALSGPFRSANFSEPVVEGTFYSAESDALEDKSIWLDLESGEELTNSDIGKLTLA